MVVGSIVSSSATGAGLMAAGIAVGGFLLHAAPALSGSPDERLRRRTVLGGLAGFACAIFIIVLSAFID
jgi:hypothetical protein